MLFLADILYLGNALNGLKALSLRAALRESMDVVFVVYIFVCIVLGNNISIKFCLVVLKLCFYLIY